MSKHQGICRLCGELRNLTFEHIPPKAAFNDRQQLFEVTNEMLRGRAYKKFPRGIGQYSLCQQCNNLTGAWYGREFVRWVEQGMEWYTKLGNRGLFYLPYYIKPLPVLKQILVMAVAMMNEATLQDHQELRQFLLNREQKYLPDKYEVYTYFNKDGKPRFASDMVVAKWDSTIRITYVQAEVALPPFGYCVCTKTEGQQSLAQYEQLCDITWFGRYEYNEWKPIQLRLPDRETHEPFPLDFRNKSEIQEHLQKSRSDKSE